MHQWGISLPGACEGLCHWRGTVEPMVANGTLKPLVAADLDLVNTFGNAEWPCIRQALRMHFPAPPLLALSSLGARTARPA